MGFAGCGGVFGKNTGAERKKQAARKTESVKLNRKDKENGLTFGQRYGYNKEVNEKLTIS